MSVVGSAARLTALLATACFGQHYVFPFGPPGSSPATTATDATLTALMYFPEKTGMKTVALVASVAVKAIVSVLLLRTGHRAACAHMRSLCLQLAIVRNNFAMALPQTKNASRKEALFLQGRTGHD